MTDKVEEAMCPKPRPRYLIVLTAWSEMSSLKSMMFLIESAKWHVW
jgi:hypothetical protein